MKEIEELKQQAKDIISDLLNRSGKVDWDTASEKTHEVIHSYLVSQITDTGESEWLSDASELVSYNETCRLIEELKNSKWFSDLEDEFMRDAFEAKERRDDPDRYYGVPRR